MDLDDEGVLRECDQDLHKEVAEIRAMIATLMRVVSGELPPKRERLATSSRNARPNAASGDLPSSPAT